MMIVYEIFKANAIYEFFNGRISIYKIDVDYQTLELMVNADVITLEGKLFKVKYVEVTDKKVINFYVSEIMKSPNEELRISHIEQAHE
jgi:hypothetical protein